MLASSLFIFSSSILVTIMSIVNLLGLVMSGYMEMSGNNKQYAKFFDANASNISKHDEEHKLPSRNGMLVFYTPAFVVGVVAFTFFPHHDTRFVMVIYVLTIHFLKRILEVLFVHKFSGSMMLNAAITIGVSYAVSTTTMIYDQYLSQESPDPSIDLKYIGLGIFLIGITGNFYHHYILSNLRKKGNKEYKIPKGGLFDLVICAHYFFEIVEFIGVACISQTISSFCITIGTVLLLMGRSHATRKWYVMKFGGKFRKDIKAVIPYIF
nr:very-long-chain enoyl-CoA reductase-like [Tanacetum cinerariifolium]